MILKDQLPLNLQERDLLGSAYPGKGQLPVILGCSLQKTTLSINFLEEC